MRRDITIDSLRGLALILMVAGHVIGSGAQSGMQVADDSGWRFFYLILDDVRMPLFTVLSGYVYALRPVLQPIGMLKMLRGKFRRLIVPLFTVGTIFYLMRIVIPAVNSRPSLSEIWRVYVYGYGHFWFLLSLFSIFVIVGVLTSVGALATMRRWVLLVAASTILFIFVRVPDDWNIFAAAGTIRLLPFFLLGYGLYFFAAELPWGKLTPVAFSISVLLLGVKASMVVRGYDNESIRTATISIVLGIMATAFLVGSRQKLRSRLLSWLGQYSFGVYLLHVFGTAGARILLGRIGVDQPFLVFVACLALGIAFPIFIEMLFGRFSVVSWSIFGQRPRKGLQVAHRSA